MFAYYNKSKKDFKMKIAIHSPRCAYFIGGTERYVLNLAKYLSLYEEVYLFTYDAPEKSEWFNNFKKHFKDKIILIKSKELDKRFSKFYDAMHEDLWDEEAIIFSLEAKKFYDNLNFDIISCHYVTDCLNLKSDNYRIWLHLHGAPENGREIEQKAIKNAFSIIALSNFIKERWKKLYTIKAPIFVVHNGIEFPKKINKVKKDKDVIFFGRLIDIKGVDILINAIAKIKYDYNKNLTCTIIGDGPKRNDLENLVERLNLKDSVTFLGRIKEDPTLFKEISRHKIAVFPSYEREGVMTTLLEASMCKTAIIASNACSIPEYIKDNYNGLLFEPKNIDELSKKILYLLDRTEILEKLVDNAYHELTNWIWEKQVKKILHLYRYIKNDKYYSTYKG